MAGNSRFLAAVGMTKQLRAFFVEHIGLRSGQVAVVTKKAASS